MTRTSVPRLPLVVVLVIAAIVAIVIGNADPEPAPAATKVDQAATLPTAGTRSGAWFCPGFPAAIPLEEQTLTVSNVGTDSGDAIVTVFPDADTLAAYVAHPVHHELVRFLDDHDCERLAFDYYLDDATRFV